MIYTFFSAVFLTLFLVLGFLTFYYFLIGGAYAMPFSWKYYRHVYVLAISAIVCFILAVVFGHLIPECYV